ncbi:MAG: Ig-like domain-containing protein [Planctomycetes bacterium]|nr:Ig-like domain-containing protein [Planctomycetota bacterium]
MPKLALFLALLAGCSGGGGSVGVSTTDCGDPDSRVICLLSCNLGCSSTGCARTDIAQNEIVILNFSDDLNPSTVGPASIRFRTASGAEPVGEFFVNGKTVEFVPTLSVSGGQTFFGFNAGETYTMTIPGGEGQLGVLRSTSGKPFDKTITCTLQSSRGIVDLNGVAPRADLVVPPSSQLEAAPLDTDIVLQFNELVDATPFIGGGQIPVEYTIRRTLVNASGVRECNPASAPQTLTGTAVLDFDAGSGRSLLTFRPTAALPSDVCIEISVTDGVRDLSGRPAQPQVFSFRTLALPRVDLPLVEEFIGAEQLETDASSGNWGGGFATFAQIGGDGRHGSFNTLSIDTGTTINNKKIWQLNTDLQVIPALNTTTGSPLAVTDGRFFFTTMVVPSDVRLRFVGSNPPVITVAGRLEILGEIDISGESIPALPSASTSTTGQAGGAGGVFGGRGGKGGDRIPQGSLVPPVADNQGSNGQDARVVSGHAYASSVVNSGGQGSTVFPALAPLGNNMIFGAPTTTFSQLACVSASAGGGGGGHRQAGGIGRVVSNNHSEPGLGNASAGQVPVNVAGATATTISVTTTGYSPTNAGLPWAANRYVGLTLEVLTLAGAGQLRTITSVSSTTSSAVITVSPAFATIPPIGSTFRVLPNPTTPLATAIGPPAAGGGAVQLLPFPPVPPTAGLTRSSLHFLVGGSGGGGSASHACMSGQTIRSFAPGLGGGGGGGAMALRAGRELRLSTVARLAARGGSAISNLGPTATASATQAPGGGGSGGSIVLQSAGDVQLLGPIDVRGGAGGDFNRISTFPTGSPGTAPIGATVVIEGGDGSDGFVRLEVPGSPSTALLSTMLPAPVADNVAPLVERDDVVGTLSKIYSTGRLFGPEYVSYEIRALVDGAPVVFSDDPAISTQEATGSSPVRALFQAVQVNISTGEVLQTGPWRTAVRSTLNQAGISSEGFNAYRFWLFVDRAFANDIRIDRVVILTRV